MKNTITPHTKNLRFDGTSMLGVCKLPRFEKLFINIEWIEKEREKRRLCVGEMAWKRSRTQSIE